MPIIGIDYEKCTNCKICIDDCATSNLSIDEAQGRVFYDKSQPCISCGHCISICPEDAIVYKNMKDDPVSFEGIQDPSTLISYETFHNFLAAKRSTRQYKKDKVPRETMEKVLNSMKYAPTGANMRNLKCLIISDEEKIKTLSRAILDSLIANPRMPEIYREQLIKRKETGKDVIFYEAPHVLVMHSNNASDNVNASIVITYGMLSAQSLGLGTCWIGLASAGLIGSKEIRKNILGLNDKILGVMIIGYPSVKYYRTSPRPPIRTKGLKDM